MARGYKISANEIILNHFKEHSMNLLSKFTKGFLAVAMFGAISAAAFTEGEDYVKLEKPLSVEQNTLVKVFSYACPFCYKYDKTVTPKVVEKVAGLK